MSKRTKSNRTPRRDRRLRIRSIRHNPPDLKKLAGALIELAEAQIEADAQAEHARKQAARQRKAERAERQREQTDEAQADRRPKDNPPSKPQARDAGVLYDRQEEQDNQADGPVRRSSGEGGGQA